MLILRTAMVRERERESSRRVRDRVSVRVVEGGRKVVSTYTLISNKSTFALYSPGRRAGVYIVILLYCCIVILLFL